MKIRVQPNYAYLEDGKAAILDRWLRVANHTARYDMSYQMGVWDGYEHLFDIDSRTFPTGLLYIVQKRCENRGIPLDIQYEFEHPETPVIEPDFIMVSTPDGEFPLRSYQIALVNRALSKGMGGIEAATGSGKSACISAIAGALHLYHGIKTCVFVSKAGLLQQTCADIRSMLPDVKVGRIGDGHREMNATISVATPQTLRKALPQDSGQRQDPQLLNLLRSCDCLILDEAHHGSAKTWFNLGLACPARYRFAFSGTLRKGKKWEDVRIKGLVGKTIYKIPSSVLWKKGVLARPTVYRLTDPRIYSNVTHKENKCRNYAKARDAGLTNNHGYNKSIARLARHLVRQGKPPLILTTRLPHVRTIARILAKNDVPHVALTGSNSTAVRSQVKEAYADGSDFCIIATTIWDEGEDVPNIASVILAGGGKTHVALKQRLGRGMRKKKGDNRVSIFDFSHSHLKLLQEHSQHRLKTYKEEGINVVEIGSITDLSSYDF